MKLKFLLRLFPKSSFSIRPYSSSNVELTSIRYKNEVKRGNYSTIEGKDISFFEKLIGKNQVISDSSDLEIHNVDWIGMVKGASQLMLKPKTTEEISGILKYCNERKLAICPQGGNTGLVGGSVPVFDEIILSTSRMNQIISLDELSGILVCQSGCILETLNEYLLERGFIMPLDLGAKGSCHIGGNVSTNAGGLRLIRYGGLHSNVLGVEAVLADGRVLDSMCAMKKDNTGYDLKHLFIGSEGSLGFVTKVVIQCAQRPNSINLAFLGLKNYENVLETFKKARRDLGEILSSCEYIDGASLRIVTGNLNLRSPISDFPFYMLIESSGSNGSHDEEKMSIFLEEILAQNLVADGTVVSEPSRQKDIWALRERIAEAMMRDGYCYKYDLSIPQTHFDELVKDMRSHLGSSVLYCTGYGHLGDGNIHLTVTCPQFDSDVLSKIEPFVYEWVSKNKGSVSAEHGLGFKKKSFITYSKSPESVAVMKQIKNLFDPNQILNPYKVLP